MAFQATTTTSVVIYSLPYVYFIIITTLLFNCCESFDHSRCSIHRRVHIHNHRYRGGRCYLHNNINSHDDGQIISSYNETDASSKGLVSTLTNVVNWFMGTRNTKTTPISPVREPLPPPCTPTELMERIRDDYTTHNYLWTGKIDISSFEPGCRFTDPTLSFVGTDNFVKNVQNLLPFIDALVADCRSDLISIQVTDEYVQSRWNMVGDMTGLPWKPRINVIGRTKFWFREKEDGVCKVYFYDESWEIPAAKALLQLITPGKAGKA
jgi:Uncharacterized conserved protein (DUF2358)